MPHESLVRNPFMMLTHPEVVMAAVEGSERLKQLNRHLCRPLDRIGPPGGGGDAAVAAADAAERDDDDGVAPDDATGQ